MGTRIPKITSVASYSGLFVITLFCTWILSYLILTGTNKEHVRACNLRSILVPRSTTTKKWCWWPPSCLVDVLMHEVRTFSDHYVCKCFLLTYNSWTISCHWVTITSHYGTFLDARQTVITQTINISSTSFPSFFASKLK